MWDKHIFWVLVTATAAAGFYLIHYMEQGVLP